jgi:hypothetical protein
MQEMRKRRAIALLFGTSLVVLLILLVWTVSTHFPSNRWPLVLLTLLLVPVIIGTTVGACVRRDVERPWRHACGTGLLTWWLILFAIFFIMTVVFLCSLPTLPPDDGQGPMSARGSLGYLYLLLSCFEVVYGGCATPLLLLGVAMSYPRRARPMRGPLHQ